MAIVNLDLSFNQTDHPRRDDRLLTPCDLRRHSLIVLGLNILAAPACSVTTLFSFSKRIICSGATLDLFWLQK
ncbi:hypothetical protein SCHPADRAFT_116378 [Schizopora paradoxa]|uniref:Uncharacterized protein n=1 Tax=Schizopora paradoxa TaxID=27342 RepID=A0A0H2S2S3_9AGAM|nr:hypothetical protein SCHPADRAFT_116378 [Schizopora paradoxa]